MTIEFLMFWAREAGANIRRNRLMSLLAISTVTVGLFILGSFFLALVNLQALVSREAGKLDLAVVLKRDVSPARRNQIMRGAKIPQVRAVRLVTRDEVLREFKRDVPQYAVDEFFGAANPLGDELRLALKNPEDLLPVKAYLDTLSGVKEVRIDEDVVKSLLGIQRVVRVAGLIALGVLGLSILMIIHNAIRLTVLARRREIRIMELVGATSGFIKMPFLLEGTLYGLLGALLAALLLSPLFLALSRVSIRIVQWLMPLEAGWALSRCIGGMVLVGLMFGLAGSWLSLSRSIGRAANG